MRLGHVVWSLSIAACAGAPPSQPPTRVVEAKVAEPEREDELAIASEPSSDGADAATSRPAMEGVWEGTGNQDDGQTWPLVITLSTVNAGRCASVDYPSIPCKAVFICTELSESGELRGKEELTEGHDRCIDNGTFSMRLDPSGRMEWFWTGGGVSARSTLERKR